MDKKKLKSLYTLSGILPKWHGKEYSDFTNDITTKKKLLTYVSKYKEMKKEAVGVFLWGANGVGKTLVMNCVFKDLLVNKRQTVKIIPLSKLVTLYADSWYNMEARRELNHIKTKVAFLGIEEIGKEFKSSSKTGQENLAITTLDDVLRSRIQYAKITWFTSNKAPSELKDSYSEDISSMMGECAIPLQVTGPDIRKTIIAKKHKDLL